MANPLDFLQNQSQLPSEEDQIVLDALANQQTTPINSPPSSPSLDLIDKIKSTKAKTPQELVEALKTSPITPPTPITAKTVAPEVDQELIDAQNTRARSNILGQLSNAGSTIASALTRGAYKATDLGSAAKEAGNRAVDDLIQKRQQEQSQLKTKLEKLASEKQMEMVDPSSQSSQTFRKAIEAQFPQVAKAYGSDWAKVSSSDKNDIWDVIKTKENIDARIEQSKLKAQELKQSREQHKDEKKTSNLIKFQENYTKDKLTNKAQEALNAASSAEALLNSKNPISDEAVKSQLARLSGEVGVLTNEDIKRFGGSKAIIDRLNQSIGEMVNGKLTDANRNYMRDLISTFKEKRENELKTRASTLAKMYSKSLKITPEEAYDYVRPGESMAANSKTELVKVMSPTGQTGSIPKENLEEALKQGYKKI